MPSDRGIQASVPVRGSNTGLLQVSKLGPSMYMPVPLLSDSEKSGLSKFKVDVSIVNPTAVSHSGAGACGESFLNPNVHRAPGPDLHWQRRVGRKLTLLASTNSYASSVVRTLYRASSQRVGGWGSSSSDSTGTHTGLGWQRSMTRRPGDENCQLADRGSPERGRHFGKPDSRSQLQTVMPA
jgi:hypothetical protein